VEFESAIRIPPVLDASHFDVRAEVAEHDSVVLGTQTVKGRVDVLETLDVAILGAEESG
jgi:hypothetical protein